MSTKTLIAWTDHTANFWIGCMKVSPGCANCYAETLAKNRMGLHVWGPPSTTGRKPVSSVYSNLRKWNKASDPANPSKVFVGSMMDWAEDHADAEKLRPAMWESMLKNDRLIFQLLTKRPERIRGLLPWFWKGIKSRVWMGVSIESVNYTHRADFVRDLDCAVRFVSYEPALGPIARALNLTGLDWVIVGGESGPGFRSMDLQWARDMKAACEAKGVAFFFKQSAAPRTEQGIELDGEIVRNYPARVALPMASLFPSQSKP